MLPKQDWAIAGGGMLGLTLASRLARAGHRVTVFEAAPAVGGLASSWEIGDAVWDKFYHVILASDIHTRQLLRELSMEDELQWRQTRTGFYVDGRLYGPNGEFWDGEGLNPTVEELRAK